MEIEKELLRGHIDIIILSMLTREDLYGYDLAKQVKGRTQGAFEIKEGTLYLAFKRLEQAGFVSSYWGEGEVGARRKYYKLLPAGLKQIRSLAQQWILLRDTINSFIQEVTPHA